MTEQQAKQVLLRYRPGSPDAAEPDIVEALAQVRQSPELQAWFDTHCAMQQAIRTQFKRISPPPGLKEQILSERKAHTAGFWPKTPTALATALAALAVLVFLAVLWLKPYLDRPDEDSLVFYRSQVIGQVLRAYSMDLETNSLASVRSYLAEKHADTGWALPKSLESLSVTGCGVIGWQTTKVSMICFHSGRTADVREPDLFLFIASRSEVPKAPSPAGAPQFSKSGKLVSASWSANGEVYVLETLGDEKTLHDYL